MIPIILLFPKSCLYNEFALLKTLLGISLHRNTTFLKYVLVTAKRVVCSELDLYVFIT